MGRPNILLITADQWRGDCLGFSGHPDVKTPNLDGLAQSGICFNRAYSAAPTCIPARAALHTGMAPVHHGRVGYRDGVRWDYEHTLAGELSKAGYYTQCVGKMHVHPLRNLIGFNNVELHDGFLHFYRSGNRPYFEDQRNADDYIHWLKNEVGGDADITYSGIDCNSWIARPWPYAEYTHPTNWVTDRAIDFLRRRDRDMPFFMHVSYVRPHPPFDAPKDFFDMYENMDITPPVIGDWADEERMKKAGRNPTGDTGPYDPELIRKAQQGYYACMTHIDYQIGRMLDALFTHELLGNTVIIFTADHGEMMCDHHMYRKGVPYEGSAHVPFILSGAYPRGNYDSERLIELSDIMPTLLNLAGAEIPSTVDGIDILGEKKHEYIHGEHVMGDRSNHYIVTEKDKYIWFTQRNPDDPQYEQYFDMINDRSELRNAIHDEKNKIRVEELRRILTDELKDREEGFVKDGKLVPFCHQDAVLDFLKLNICK